MMENKTVPYIAYEATQARHERTTKRLIIALIIVTALMFISNIAWLYTWMQYDYTGEETQTEYRFSQDSEGLNNINMGFQGDVNDGAESGYNQTNTDKN